MRRFVTYAIVLSAAAVIFSGCGHRRDGVIPKHDMINVYHDMFVADQWLRDNSLYKAESDTTLFYEPIFRKYGYTFADYDRSVTYYIANRKEYVDILEAVSARIIKEANALDKLAVEYARIREANRQIRGYERIDFGSLRSRWSLADIYWPVHPRTTVLPGDRLLRNDDAPLVKRVTRQYKPGERVPRLEISTD